MGGALCCVVVIIQGPMLRPAGDSERSNAQLRCHLQTSPGLITNTWC